MADTLGMASGLHSQRDDECLSSFLESSRFFKNTIDRILDFRLLEKKNIFSVFGIVRIGRGTPVLF